MSGTQGSLAAALVLGLRTPLARLSLAASQLSRESANPAGERLAASVADAVAQIEAGIERALPLLVPAQTAEPARARVSEVVGPLVTRLRPAFAARDVALRVDATGFDSLRCPPHATRRIAAGLLRAGAHWLDAGGRATLSVAREDARAGLCLDCEARETRVRDTAGFHELAGAAAGCELELDLAPARARAVLWLASLRAHHPDAENDPCDAC